jgi:hypothetical protein
VNRGRPTCVDVKAGVVEGAHEELEADDGVDDDDKEHEEGDVHQGDDGHKDGVHHNLKTFEGTKALVGFSTDIICKITAFYVFTWSTKFGQNRGDICHSVYHYLGVQ